MSIDSVTSTAVTATSDGSLSQLSQDYETFLNLLVAQVQNQDPLEPMDATQFVSQIATLTQVEQSVALNGQLEDLRSALAVNASLSEANLIGRTVTVPSDTVRLSTAGEPVGFSYELQGDATSVSVMIKDTNGNLLRQIDGLSGESGRLHEIVWDGHDSAGNPIGAGEYTIALAAEGASGGYNTYARDKVVSISYVAGEQLLDLSNGSTANSGAIMKIE